MAGTGLVLGVGYDQEGEMPQTLSQLPSGTVAGPILCPLSPI